MARPKNQANRVETSERLLGAAEAAFADHGYLGAKLEDIAAEAGVRRPSLLYHYKTKEALYSAVVTRVFADLAEALATAIDAQMSFRAQLDRLFEAFTDFITGRPSVPRLILREILDPREPGRDLLLESTAQVLDWAVDVLEARGADEIPQGIPVRFALLSLVSNTFVKVASGPLEHALWGSDDATSVLVHRLFLKGASA